MRPVGMRTDCKHYESRSYANGETVRKCRLDLAPGAPWECPADCAAFTLRRADVGWDYGSLRPAQADRKSTRLNSSHSSVSRMPSSA